MKQCKVFKSGMENKVMLLYESGVSVYDIAYNLTIITGKPFDAADIRKFLNISGIKDC